MQGTDKAVFLGPVEKAIKEAKTETARKHREEYLANVTTVFNVSNSTVLALPNRPVDPSKLPMKVDLGGVTAVVENYSGDRRAGGMVAGAGQDVVYSGGPLLFNEVPAPSLPPRTARGV